MDDDSEGDEDEDEGDYSDNDYEEYEELVSLPSLFISAPNSSNLLQPLQEIDENDQALLDSYLPQGQLEGGRTLADLIMEKIDAQEAGPAEPARESFWAPSCFLQLTKLLTHSRS